jgi:hypothetical protein
MLVSEEPTEMGWFTWRGNSMLPRDEFGTGEMQATAPARGPELAPNNRPGKEYTDAPEAYQPGASARGAALGTPIQSCTNLNRLLLPSKLP